MALALSNGLSCCLWRTDSHWPCVNSPVYPQEEADEENIIEDDAELTLNQVEKELINEDIEEDFEEEENILGLDDLKRMSMKSSVSDSSHLAQETMM